MPLLPKAKTLLQSLKNKVHGLWIASSASDPAVFSLPFGQICKNASVKGSCKVNGVTSEIREKHACDFLQNPSLSVEDAIASCLKQGELHVHLRVGVHIHAALGVLCFPLPF